MNMTDLVRIVSTYPMESRGCRDAAYLERAKSELLASLRGCSLDTSRVRNVHDLLNRARAIEQSPLCIADKNIYQHVIELCVVIGHINRIRRTNPTRIEYQELEYV